MNLFRYINKAFLVLFILCLTLGLPLTSWSQDVLVFSELEIDLWPEYDRPGVLVIYHITLPAEMTLPVDISLSIPTEAGDPNAVAVRDANGGLFSIVYSREVNGEWSKISFAPTMSEIQVEYYDPRLVINGKSHSYQFFWLGDYAINSLSIEVQQPIGASEMKITPNMGEGTTRADGLLYYTSQAGSLDAGQMIELSLEYQKEGEALSAQSLEVEPSSPVSTISPDKRNLMTVLPWVLGTLGVVLIVGGGIWWYWQSGFGKGRPKTPRRRRKLVVSAEQDVPEGYVYCHHCGKRALTGDKFCRTCGTRLRI
jgi:hypothetical protein